MRSTLPFLAVFVALGFSGLHCAYAGAPPPRAADASVSDRSPAAVPRMELVDDGMDVLPMYDQDGRRYVLGQMGQRYQVHIVNPTGARVEAVVSVDGLDAVDGHPANLNKRGYIIPAYSDVTIDGFRTSLDTVAAFRFSSVRDSYAARTRHARNVGVVGVAFFRERPPPAPHYESRPLRREPASPVDDAERAVPNAAPSPPSSTGRASADKSAEGASAAARPGLGTRFGESRESHVMETNFVRAESSPMTIAELRYDDRDGLLSRGIQLDPPVRDPRDAENDLRDTAQPFPGSRFAQPPPPR
jgi:hypothetical protein